MSINGIIMMLLSAGIVWGGLAVLLTKLMKNKDEDENQDNNKEA